MGSPLYFSICHLSTYTHNHQLFKDHVARRRATDNKKPAISNGFFTSSVFFGPFPGGDEGDRTPGLGVANAALSQLSYIPIFLSKWRGNGLPSQFRAEHI